MRDFAGPEWDLSVDGESSRECGVPGVAAGRQRRIVSE